MGVQDAEHLLAPADGEGGDEDLSLPVEHLLYGGHERGLDLPPVLVVGVGVGALDDDGVEFLAGDLGPVDEPGLHGVDVPSVEYALPLRLQLNHGAALDVPGVHEAELDVPHPGLPPVAKVLPVLHHCVELDVLEGKPVPAQLDHVLDEDLHDLRGQRGCEEGLRPREIENGYPSGVVEVGVGEDYPVHVPRPHVARELGLVADLDAVVQ